MRKLILAVLLVLVLLSLFAGVAFATCPEYEDKVGVSPGGDKGGNTNCAQVSGAAAAKGKFAPCPKP